MYRSEVKFGQIRTTNNLFKTNSNELKQIKNESNSNSSEISASPKSPKE